MTESLLQQSPQEEVCPVRLLEDYIHQQCENIGASGPRSTNVKAKLSGHKRRVKVQSPAASYEQVHLRVMNVNH